MRSLLRAPPVVAAYAVSAFAFASALGSPIACTVRANVGDLDALPADSGASDGRESDGGASQPADASDPSDAREEGGRESSIDVGCGVTFAQEASFVDIGVVTGAPPTLEGGAVATGTYALVAMRVYFGPAQGTMQIRETLLVRGSATAGAFERLTEARSATGTFTAYPLHGEVSTWEVAAGPGYFEQPECPKKDTGVYRQFDVSGDTLKSGCTG